MLAVVLYCIRSRSGVTAIEYALIAALISLAILTGAGQVGSSVKQFFTTISNSF
ncbi:MAG: Flp family type IVb pilin [Stellaceae bacterium]